MGESNRRCSSQPSVIFREGFATDGSMALPVKNGGWKTILSYWVSVTFQGRTVKLRGGMKLMKTKEHTSTMYICISHICRMIS